MTVEENKKIVEDKVRNYFQGVKTKKHPPPEEKDYDVPEQPERQRVSSALADEAEKEEAGCSGAPAQAEKEAECRHAPEKEAECPDHSPAEEEAECPDSPEEEEEAEASSSEGL